MSLKPSLDRLRSSILRSTRRVSRAPVVETLLPPTIAGARWARSTLMAQARHWGPIIADKLPYRLVPNDSFDRMSPEQQIVYASRQPIALKLPDLDNAALSREVFRKGSYDKSEYTDRYNHERLEWVGDRLVNGLLGKMCFTFVPVDTRSAGSVRSLEEMRYLETNDFLAHIGHHYGIHTRCGISYDPPDTTPATKRVADRVEAFCFALFLAKGHRAVLEFIAPLAYREIARQYPQIEGGPPRYQPSRLWPEESSWDTPPPAPRSVAASPKSTVSPASTPLKKVTVSPASTPLKKVTSAVKSIPPPPKLPVAPKNSSPIKPKATSPLVFSSEEEALDEATFVSAVRDASYIGSYISPNLVRMVCKDGQGSKEVSNSIWVWAPLLPGPKRVELQLKFEIFIRSAIKHKLVIIDPTRSKRSRPVADAPVVSELLQGVGPLHPGRLSLSDAASETQTRESLTKQRTASNSRVGLRGGGSYSLELPGIESAKACFVHFNFVEADRALRRPAFDLLIDLARRAGWITVGDIPEDFATTQEGLESSNPPLSDGASEESPVIAHSSVLVEPTTGASPSHIESDLTAAHGPQLSTKAEAHGSLSTAPQDALDLDVEVVRLSRSQSTESEVSAMSQPAVEETCEELQTLNAGDAADLALGSLAAGDVPLSSAIEPEVESNSKDLPASSPSTTAPPPKVSAVSASKGKSSVKAPTSKPARRPLGPRKLPQRMPDVM